MPHANGWIFFTFLLALCLSIIALPEWAAWVRMPWVPVLLLFWVLRVPQRMGLGFAFGMGIILDALNGTLLGLHALGLVIITFLFLRFYRQIRMFPMMQQATIVALLMLIYQGILFFIQNIIGQPVDGRLFWFPVLTTLIMWPALSVFL
ncbi:MAG: rod shape-determining protein MreD [Gammaproteobacteria bacterium]